MRRKVLLIIAILALLDLTSLIVHAQTGGGYDLTWNSIDGGGMLFSADGKYSLYSTMGQLDAGAMSGGIYTLVGGFWGGGMTPYQIYLPLVVKNS